MILSPEEQSEYREEIDYAIENFGYEYVWGKETPLDKTKGLLRDAPSKLIEGFNKLVTNPTVININEKLKAHAEKINAQDEQRWDEPEPSRHPPRRKPAQKSARNIPARMKRRDTLGGGGGLGGGLSGGLGGGSDLRDGFNFGDDHL